MQGWMCGQKSIPRFRKRPIPQPVANGGGFNNNPFGNLGSGSSSGGGDWFSQAASKGKR